MHLSIGQAAEVIGVSISTLRRWDEENYFNPDFRTKGGHRRYSLQHIQSKIISQDEEQNKNTRKTYSYARVSSHDQKLDLKRQEKRLAKYCKENDWEFELISDLGSVINYKKKGLNKLIKLICQQRVKRLVLTHKDRLLRFGSPLLFKLCEFFNTEVIIIEKQKSKTFEEELAADVIEIMTVFTSKLYGKRSHKNRKACAQ